MELSPRSVANTSFKTVKKGYDPAEVRSYLQNLAKSVENLQSQATAMEARARAAVARLQEIASQPSQDATPAPLDSVAAPTDEADIISRTLLLAQRTADVTIAEANAEAVRITETADERCRDLISEAQASADQMIEEGKLEARRMADGERVQIESEVQSLLARREFLLSDVDHLEQHVVDQRERLRDVANALTEMISNVPGGLGDLHRPLVSAVGDDDSSSAEVADDAGPVEATPGAGQADNQGENQSDGTPPSGRPNRFLFEDITDEMQRLTPPPTEVEPTVDSDDPKPSG